MTQLICGGTTNGDFHFGEKYARAQLRAAGFQVKPTGSPLNRSPFDGHHVLPELTVGPKARISILY